MPSRKRRGQALAEFALTTPVFLALLLGVVDVAWLYNHQLMLTHAAREGARQGAFGQSASQIQTTVRETLQQSGFSPVPTVSQIQVDLSGGKARVTVNATVPTLFSITGPQVQLRAATEMRLE